MKLWISLVLPFIVALFSLRVMILLDLAYLDDNNIPKFDKTYVMEASEEAQKKCRHNLYSTKIPMEAEDLVYYSENTIIFASGHLLRMMLYGVKAKAGGGNIYIYDAKKDEVFPMTYKGYSPGRTFAPHGLFYSSETKILYIINHFAGQTKSGIEVFSVIQDPGAEYPSLEHLGTLKSGFQFGKINNIVESGPGELFITESRARSLPRYGLKGDVSLFDSAYELIAMIRASSKMLYNTGFIYCKFDVNSMQKTQVCLEASKTVKFGMANGIAINKNVSKDYNHLYISDSVSGDVQVFRVPKEIMSYSFYQQNAIRNQIVHIDTISLVDAADNIVYDNSRGVLLAGGIPSKFHHLAFVLGRSETPIPGSMMMIDPETHQSKRLLYHSGNLLNAISACVFTTVANNNSVVCGSPYDGGLLICELG